MVKDTLFVSSAALHLFLQTELSRKDMDAVIKEAKRHGSMNSVVRAISMYGERYDKLASRHSVTHLNNSIGRSGLNRLTNVSQSVPLLNSLARTDTSGSSESITSDEHVCGRTSSQERNVKNLSNRCSNQLQSDSDCFEENNYGDWVVINNTSNSASSIASLNSSGMHSEISSQNFTKVSWTLGDPSPSERDAAPQSDAAPTSNAVPVPPHQHFKTVLSGQFRSQSLEEQKRLAVSSESSLKPDTHRRAASDTLVADEHAESPPLTMRQEVMECALVERRTNSNKFYVKCKQSTAISNELNDRNKMGQTQSSSPTPNRLPHAFHLFNHIAVESCKGADVNKHPQKNQNKSECEAAPSTTEQDRTTGKKSVVDITIPGYEDPIATEETSVGPIPDNPKFSDPASGLQVSENPKPNLVIDDPESKDFIPEDRVVPRADVDCKDEQVTDEPGVRSGLDGNHNNLEVNENVTISTEVTCNVKASGTDTSECVRREI